MVFIAPLSWGCLGEVGRDKKTFVFNEICLAVMVFIAPLSWGCLGEVGRDEKPYSLFLMKYV